MGCRDDTVPKQEGTAGRVESMQLSSATPKSDVGIWLRKIVSCSQRYLRSLLVSTVFGSVIYFIFILVSPLFYVGLALTVVSILGAHMAKNP